MTGPVPLLSSEGPPADETARALRHRRWEQVTAILGWALILELGFVAALCALGHVGPRRMFGMALAVGALLAGVLAPLLPASALPLRGKWLRRFLAGSGALLLLYAGPWPALQRAISLGWSVGQAQSKLTEVLNRRPDLEMLGSVARTDLPEPLATMPLSLATLIAGAAGGLQFACLWRQLGTDDRGAGRRGGRRRPGR